MTDKEIAEKKEELEALMAKLEIGGNWWPQGFVVYSDELDEVWQFIEEVIGHYYTQGKIEGYKECLEEQDEHGSYGTSFEN